MTDRSPVERPTACPFLAFDDDRDYRSDRPDHRHRCFAEPRPAPRAISHQELFCIGGAFGECPTFLAWAAREAATVRRPTVRRGDIPVAPRGAADRGPYDAPAPPPDREWQAPPPWMAGAVAGAAGAAAGPAAADVAGAGGVPPAAAPTDAVDLDDQYEMPAFLAGRASRPPAPGAGATAATPGSVAGTPDVGYTGAATAAAAGAAASSAFIGGSPGLADGAADDLGDLASDRDAAFAATGGAYATPLSAAPRPAPAAQPISGRSSGASGGRPPTSGRGTSDTLLVEPDVDLPAEDEAWEDPVEAAAAARIARNAPRKQSSSRFGIGRSTPSSGQARPLPQRAADPAAPAWERPRRFDTYPTIKSSGGGPRGIPRIAIWLGLLALAALALFLIPPLLLGGGGGSDATPAPSASAAASPSASVAPTPVPSPTPFVYKVKAGDTVSGIAAKYKITVDDLLAANPDLKDPNQLQIGDKLVIPLPASSVIPDAGTPGAEATAAP